MNRSCGAAANSAERIIGKQVKGLRELVTVKRECEEEEATGAKVPGRRSHMAIFEPGNLPQPVPTE